MLLGLERGRKQSRTLEKQLLRKVEGTDLCALPPSSHYFHACVCIWEVLKVALLRQRDLARALAPWDQVCGWMDAASEVASIDKKMVATPQREGLLP